MAKYSNIQEFIGVKYGRLTIISIKRIDSRLYCEALCECGRTGKFNHSKLVIGHTKSCGCLHREVLNSMIYKHGEAKTRLHNIWVGMRSRCFNNKNNSYIYYGGKGISICNGWGDYLTFKNWAINNGYKNHLTIERIDANGNYEPSNCMWATGKEQSYNKTNTHVIEYKGHKKAMGEWAELLGIKYNTLCSRINTYKWPIDKALNYVDI